MKKSLELVRAERQMLNLLLGRYCSGFINGSLLESSAVGKRGRPRARGAGLFAYLDLSQRTEP